MGRLFAVCFVLISTILLITSCGHPRNVNYTQAMHDKLQRWTPYSNAHLQPYFQHANVAFPPKELAFLIFKRSRQLQMYARDSSGWHYICNFPVLAASGSYGPKLHSGDRQVPEGIYQITEFNPRSHYDLSMRLNYPNNFDDEKARQEGRMNLGNDIYLHGDKSSVGCIAMGNPVIRQLFPLVHEVGKKNVTVVIAPNDFRRSLPVYGRVRPQWLPELYTDITRELSHYPVPRLAY